MLYGFGDIFRMDPFGVLLTTMFAVVMVIIIAATVSSNPQDTNNVPDSWIQAKEVYEQCLEEAPEGVFCLTEVKKSYWLSTEGVSFIKGE